jgi:ribosome assembly protein 4
LFLPVSFVTLRNQFACNERDWHFDIFPFFVEKMLGVFESPDGESVGPPLNIPVEITKGQLQLLLNCLLGNDDKRPYAFYIDEIEITQSLKMDYIDRVNKSSEETVRIVYQPEALFRVRAVTRCSSSLTGHSESILSVQFSPDGRRAASASGDGSVRIWDLTTETPLHVCDGHKGWVLCISWSPDGKFLASGSMDNQVIIWSVDTGKPVAVLSGHTKWITCLSWKPFHLDPNCRQLVSASRDCTARVWDVMTKRCEYIVSQHTDAVSSVRWSGENLIYTASRDRTVKVWDARDVQYVIDSVLMLWFRESYVAH